jgi:hypothetical protein
VDDILGVALQLARVCERLGLRYVLGGSLASSLHGVPRATEDADIVIAMGIGDVTELIEALRGEFYLDADAIRHAVEQQSSFNVIHLGSYFKVDVFVARRDEASRLQFERARRYDVGGGELVVASAEDVIAQKLFWYALGERVSERQWSDALGVLRVARPHLDWDYLHHVAGLLGVIELLEQARRAAEASEV